MTTTWGPIVYPAALDGFAPSLIDNVDEVIANHPNSLATAIRALETKLGITNNPVTGLGGISFDPAGKAANPGVPGTPTIWADNSGGPGFTLYYTDDLGSTFDITAGGVTIRDWAPATVYTVDQEVIYVGLRFRCLAGHTSGGTFFNDTDMSKWTCVSGEGLIVNQAAHGFSELDVVYSLAGVWTLADASSSATLPDPPVVIIGVGTAVNYFLAAQDQIVTVLLHGLVVDDIYYLSAAVAGQLTNTAPTGAGEYVCPIVRVLSANTLAVLPYRPLSTDVIATPTLDLAYDGGLSGSGAGRSITADSGSVAITVPDTSNNVGLEITQNDVTNDPVAMTITNAGDGSSLTISNAGTGASITLAGAGSRLITSDNASLTISTTTAGDIDINSFATVDIDGVTVEIDASGGFAITGVTASTISAGAADLSFQGYAVATSFNDAVNTGLVGFTATTIMGALNELRSDLTAEDLWDKAGTVLAPHTAGDTLQVGVGTKTAPSYSFEGDPDTGIYHPGADEIGFSVNDTDLLTITSTAITGTVFFVTPSMAPSSDYQVANKKYVDDQVDTVDTWAEILALGNVSGGTNPTISKNDTIDFLGATSGTISLAPTAIAGTNTLTLPAATDTLVGKATGDVFTNKSISFTTNTVTGTAAEFDTACSDDNFAFVSDNLSVFAATTSLQLAGVISDETGSGALVFGTSPALTTPTGIIASDIEMLEIATATYDDVQDWSNTTQSAGVISGGVITDGGSGTIDISAITGILKTTNSEVGANVFFDFGPVVGQALTDDATNYILLDYNGGSPQLSVGLTNTANGHDIITLGTVFREGDTLDIIDSATELHTLARRVQRRFLEGNFLQFISGGVVTETGTRNLDITSGIIYFGLNRLISDEVDTSLSHTITGGGSGGTISANDTIVLDSGEGNVTANYVLGNNLLIESSSNGNDGHYHVESSSWDGTNTTVVIHETTLNTGADTGSVRPHTFEYYYYNGAAWIETNATQIDNTYYNNVASGLVELGVAKYGVHWVYKGTNGSTYVLYGQGSYLLSEAQSAQPPSSVPEHVSGFGVLRAKIIILKSAAAFTEISSVVDTTFTTTTPSLHNELGGIQGGAANDYYHLTLARHTSLTGGVTYDASSLHRHSLDSDYDSSGSGVGRSITADSGAVAITVSNSSNNAALELIQNDVANNPNAATITNAGTGSSIELAGTTRKINSTSGDMYITTTTTGDLYVEGLSIWIEAQTPTTGYLSLKSHGNVEIGADYNLSQTAEYMEFDLPGDKAGTFMSLGSHAGGAVDGSSGTDIWLNVLPLIRSDGTAGYTALNVDVNQTGFSGSGTTTLLDLQVATATKFNVRTDGTVNVVGDIVTTEAIGRDTDNELAWTSDDQLDITIGGVTHGIVSITNGAGDNDKLVTQGYVDDNDNTPGGSTGQIQWNNASALDGTDNAYWDDTYNTLILGNVTTSAWTDANLGLQISRDDDTFALMSSAGSTNVWPRMYLLASRGTHASPTATQSGDVLGQVVFVGMRGTALSSYGGGGSVAMAAAETFTLTNRGSKFSIDVVNIGDTSSAVRYLIEGNSDHIWYGAGSSPSQIMSLTASTGALAVTGDLTLTGGGSILSTSDGDITLSPDGTGYIKNTKDYFTDSILASNTNTFFGVLSTPAGLAHTTGSEGWQNTLIGRSAGSSITTGFANTCFGYSSGSGITTGYGNLVFGGGGAALGGGAYNLILGASAGLQVAANYNTLIGVLAGQYINGDSNVAIGYGALKGATGASTGANNVAIGYNAGLAITTGGTNILVGRESGKLVADGVQNICIGYLAGAGAVSGITSGDYNVVIGPSVDVPSATANYQLNICNVIKNTNWNTGGDLIFTPQGTGITAVGANNTSHTLSGPNDLFVNDALEVDGIAYIDGGLIARGTVQAIDNIPIAVGDSNDFQLRFSTAQATSNSTLACVDSTSRTIILTDLANYTKDHDHAAQTNPTLFIHSATDPDSDNTQWGSLAHNQTDFVISTGKGKIQLLPVAGSITQIGAGSPNRLSSPTNNDAYIAGRLEVDGALSCDSVAYFGSYLAFSETTTTYYGGIYPGTDDGTRYAVGSNDGYGNRNFIITDAANITKDHDHDTLSLNPILIGHSVTDPDTDNTQWWSLTHDQTDFVQGIGSGSKVTEYEAPVELADDEYFDLPDASSGYGTFHIGDGVAFAIVSWTSAGVVTLVQVVGDVDDADTNGQFCFFDNGTSVRVRNRTGSTVTVMFDYKYTTNPT